MATTVITTGLAQVDTALATLEPKVQAKFARKALRNVAKKIVDACKAIVRAEAYDTGTLEKSFKVRAAKRSRKRLGVQMFVDREKLFANYAATHGHAPHPRTGETEPFYYLASVEFGYKRKDGVEVPAVRPMRRALYDNAEAFKAFFVQDLREIINGAAVRRQLTGR